MSNIPKNRDDLLALIEKHFSKLQKELEGVSEQDSDLACDDDFSIKDILAVRLWWTRAVMAWIEEGRQGGTPVTPAEGYNWRQTPALNLEIARKAHAQSYAETCDALLSEKERLLSVIASLSDHELEDIGVFPWADKWPIMRWISIGTSSQYDGARKLIRKAMKAKS